MAKRPTENALSGFKLDVDGDVFGGDGNPAGEAVSFVRESELLITVLDGEQLLVSDIGFNSITDPPSTSPGTPLYRT